MEVRRAGAGVGGFRQAALYFLAFAPALAALAEKLADTVARAPRCSTRLRGPEVSTNPPNRNPSGCPAVSWVYSPKSATAPGNIYSWAVSFHPARHVGCLTDGRLVNFG